MYSRIISVKYYLYFISEESKTHNHVSRFVDLL